MTVITKFTPWKEWCTYSIFDAETRNGIYLDALAYPAKVGLLGH